MRASQWSALISTCALAVVALSFSCDAFIGWRQNGRIPENIREHVMSMTMAVDVLIELNAISLSYSAGELTDAALDAQIDAALGRARDSPEALLKVSAVSMEVSDMQGIHNRVAFERAGFRAVYWIHRYGGQDAIKALELLIVEGYADGGFGLEIDEALDSLKGGPKFNPW